jgi:hypothetical protein
MAHEDRRAARLSPFVALLAALTAAPRAARAQAQTAAPAQTPAAPPADASLLPTQSTIPPPVGNPFIQYGVAFTTEVLATAGPMCANGGVPCILGSGGGIVFPRIGWRSSGPWYFGGAYEISKQDANTLYQLAILQQLRGEGRYYFQTGQVINPYLGASAGIAGYGNEWSIDTFGPTGSVTLGLEAQVSRGTVVGAALNYRVIYFRSFVDTANLQRDASLAQLFGLDIQLEVRDPF